MRIVNKRKFIKSISILILIIMILIFVLIYLFTKKDREETKEVSNINIVKIEENNIEEKTDLNHLKENEPSFGNINVKTYKIGEKDIKIPILIYHAFQTPVPENDIYKLFSTQERFEENVKTLLDNGYTFITLEDLYKYKNGKISLPQKNIIITMDDGWKGCYTEAFEVLKKYKVPATIFIVEELVGTSQYFTWDEAKEMYDTGLVKIHVHGRKHIDYSNVSKETLISDYNHTHNKIEEVLGDKVQKIMAYPAGASSKASKKYLKEAGFEIQVQTRYGTVNKSSDLDLTNLGRIRGEQASGKTILKAIGNQ